MLDMEEELSNGGTETKWEGGDVGVISFGIGCGIASDVTGEYVGARETTGVGLAQDLIVSLDIDIDSLSSTNPDKDPEIGMAEDGNKDRDADSDWDSVSRTGIE